MTDKMPLRLWRSDLFKVQVNKRDGEKYLTAMTHHTYATPFTTYNIKCKKVRWRER
jgi:hypothetical protein